MTVPTLRELVPILQIAVIPVILISGVGLLLLTLTNRFARVSDRVRCLVGDARKQTETDKARLQPQIAALFQRARLLRAAVSFASLSMLLNVALVITLFVAALLGLEFAIGIGLLFLASMIALAAAVIYFLCDIHLSLGALSLEVSSVAAHAAEATPGRRSAPQTRPPLH